MNGWMNTWMDDSNTHPQISGGTPKYSGHFLGLPLLKIPSPMGSGWMYVCMNKGGKFIHPQI
jgi:hypothetical protein